MKDLVKKAIENDNLKKEIKKVSLFGSYLKGIPQEDSDVDLLIEFTPSARIGFFKFVGVQQNIESMVGKKIDLLTLEALSKHFRTAVLKEAETVYEG
ncbi:MAG: nucleotidyltransferase [Candidatus Saganbacteria bacterium]|uniref:Nucleotidyltransferase n=1 Tax=Candidatus Saganbacteria bacterium TaxID=2575572 RepID=A0A833L138_UNCSA|nr:MAG: nucleotidyltransferase [Candidatus Saganbacteria bacterium]